MSDDRWNDDITYVFSIHRTFLQILGIWPLQKRTVFTMMQYSLITLLQLTTFIFVFMEFARNDHDTGENIKTILFFAYGIAMVLKYQCIAANQRKLARNIDAAISDWLSARNDKETHKIMKKYAFKSRLLILIIFYSGYVTTATYISGFIFLNLKQILSAFQDVNITNGNTSTMNWILYMPSGDLNEKITGSQFAMLSVLQILQSIMMDSTTIIVDSFYINIIVHLTGQLNVLTKKFKIFANKPDTGVNYLKQLTSLINRHCELYELNQNIEDTFHLIILLQVIIITLLLALLGLNLIMCSRNNDYVELPKTIVVWTYVIIESLVFCYGGDFVQRESEGIFHAIFTAPAASMKDLYFVMLRSSYPFRLTGGKFFYVNRETMLYVLKTAASYVSVLRMMMNDD